MVYGVMFHVEKDYPSASSVFRKLLETINIERYFCKVDESDVYKYEPLENIVEKGIYKGEKLLSELSQDFFMIWIALEGYKNEKSVEELDGSFQKYIESKCETAVFVVDVYMFAVYSKNPEVLKKAIDFAESNNTGKFEIIEDKNADWYFGV